VKVITNNCSDEVKGTSAKVKDLPVKTKYVKTVASSHEVTAKDIDQKTVQTFCEIT